MRIVFAGTPAFALPALAALVGSEAWRPVVVLAQPDRGAGRGRKLRFGPVKQAAVEAGIEVLQPHTLKDADARAALADLRPDLIVTAAYGLLLPPERSEERRVGEAGRTARARWTCAESESGRSVW